MERNNKDGRNKDEQEITEKLVGIERVTKVVKGGKNLRFRALVVVGDQKGCVGFGAGKAREVPEAVQKAAKKARRAMVRVPLKEGRTLHHDNNGHFGAGRVHLRTAPPGTGIIAGGPMRAVFECLGVQDVVSKSIGTKNYYNMVRATFDALTSVATPKSVASRLGRKVSDIIARREVANRKGKANGKHKRDN